MVWTVFSRVSPRIVRLASASFWSATSFVVPVPRMRRTSATTLEGPTAETKTVRRPTVGSPRSSKPQAEARSRSARRSLDNDVHQPAGDDDHLLRLLPRHELDDRHIAQRHRLDLLACRVRGNAHMAAQLAVHLHDELDVILHERRGVDGGPRLPEEARPRPQLRPEGGGDE